MATKKRSEVLPSIPFVWCWWWDLQSSEHNCADGLTATGASHTVWVPNASAFVEQSSKVPPTKKDPKVFLVLVVGLEPTRSPTRPLRLQGEFIGLYAFC